MLLLPLQLTSNLTQSKTRVTLCIRAGNNVPVYSRFRKYKIAKDEFQFLLDAGIIRRVRRLGVRVPLGSPVRLFRY